MGGYLAEAKDKVDKAVAEAEANLNSDTDIEELLWNASEAACRALQLFHSDKERGSRAVRVQGDRRRGPGMGEGERHRPCR